MWDVDGVTLVLRSTLRVFVFLCSSFFFVITFGRLARRRRLKSVLFV